MNKRDYLEQNIDRLINSTEPQIKMPDAKKRQVLSELVGDKERKQESTSIWRLIISSRMTKYAASAAAVIVIAVNWNAYQGPAERIGQVRNMYGIVTINNGGAGKNVKGIADIHAGEWIETLSGSMAAIVLNDMSRLLLQPRTVFQLINGKNGHGILLKQGSLAIEASKQLAGNSLRVETPGSQIKILGTKLNVRVVQKPDGGKRTQVRVTSGSVELESSGEKVLLLRHTDGIADEGEAPIVRSVTPEVNEMIRLIALSKELADKGGTKAGGASILDFHIDGSTTVWTVATMEESEQPGTQECSVKLKYPVYDVRAFTVGGVELETSREGQTLLIDFSQLPSGVEKRDQIILKLSNMKGMFRVLTGSVFEFSRSGDNEGVTSLFQFRTPKSASIEISPEPIEQYQTLNKTVITVVSDSQIINVFD